MAQTDQNWGATADGTKNVCYSLRVQGQGHRASEISRHSWDTRSQDKGFGSQGVSLGGSSRFKSVTTVREVAGELANG